MRKLLSFLIRVEWVKSQRTNMLRKNSNAGVSREASVIEQPGRETFDFIAELEKLFLSVGAAALACKSIHRRTTDLALDGYTVVQHREAHGHSVSVIAHRFAPRERHRNISPRSRCAEWAGWRFLSRGGRPKMLFTFLIALAAMVWLSLAPSFAQGLMTLGAGSVKAAPAAATFTGPGDLTLSGAFHQWAGFSCYKASAPRLRPFV
jgi:hypothetical protein